MNSILVPFCPALPAICSAPRPVTHSTMSPVTVDLLRTNPSVVISGRCRNDFRPNRRIGKSTAVRNRLGSLLRNNAMSYSYLDIQKLISRADRFGKIHADYSALARRAERLRDVRVHIFDEIQHCLIVKPLLERLGEEGETYRQAIERFWERVSEHLEEGGRAVFISCEHPLDRNFADILLSERMTPFFTSPVLELGL